MENNHDEILAIVFKLYNKYGIKSITMDEVARELGISKKTLYQHFNDKADLVEHTIFRNISKHMLNIQKIQQGELNAIEELLAINKYLTTVIDNEHNPAIDFDLSRYYPKLFKKFHENRRKHTFNSLLANLKKGIKEGLYRENMNPDIIASVHLSRMEKHMEDESLVFQKYHQTELFKEIYTYHIYGICSRKGVELFEQKIKELETKN
ncbi:MAG: TetR/AcrR family transcriptional regulator [Bacteroidales bacterium]|nr:TetR/AcrR family transcriptional regulator [Bacteroidales bacterium]